MERKIYLTKGKFAIVDADDYDRLSRYCWYFSQGYAKRSQVKGEYNSYATRKEVKMHRDILGLSVNGRSIQCDHINGDRLDNRRVNLRIATNFQNSGNYGAQKNNKLGVRGVRQRQWGFEASIRANGKRHYLGCFNTIEEATAAYRAAAKLHFGEFAK